MFLNLGIFATKEVELERVPRGFSNVIVLTLGFSTFRLLLLLVEVGFVFSCIAILNLFRFYLSIIIKNFQE